MRHVLTTASETLEDDFASLQRALADASGPHSLNAADACAFWSPQRSVALNTIADARIAPDAVERRATEILAPYFERRLPFQWLTTPATTSPALEAALAGAGLRAREYPAMHASLRSTVDPALSADLYIDIVWPEQLRELDVALFNAFGHPLETGLDRGSAAERLDPTAHHYFLARSLSDGQILGVSSMRTQGNTVMFTHVACLAPARGRGVEHALAATMMNRAASTGADSASVIANHATYQVFLELGFRTQFNVVAWVWQPPM